MGPAAAICLLLVATAAVAWGAWRLAALLHPNPSFSGRIVAAGLLAYGAVIASGTLLGWMGLLAWPLWHLLAGGAGAALGLLLPPGRPLRPWLPRRAAARSRRALLLWSILVGAGGAALAFALFVAWRQDLKAADDVLGYHLPLAVEWLKAGRLTAGTNPGLPESWLPHATGLVLAWAAAPLKAETLAWAAMGPSWPLWALTVYRMSRLAGGRGPASGLGAASLLALPGFLEEWGFTARNDAFLAWTFLAAVLYLAEHAATGRARPVILAGLAAGLMLGSKGFAPIWLALVVLAGLGARACRPRREGERTAAAWAAFAAACLLLGGHWYLRNWLATGNPAWPFAVRLGGMELFAGIRGEHLDRRIGLDPGHFLRHPGIGAALGAPGFWLLAALGAWGGLAVLRRGLLSRRRRFLLLLAAAAGLALLAYLYSPYTAIQKVQSLRRGFPALGLLFALAGAVPDRSGLLALAAALWAARNIGFVAAEHSRYWPGFLAVGLGLAFMACLRLRSARPAPAPRPLRAAVAAGLGVLLWAALLGQHSFRTAYRFTPGFGFCPEKRGTFGAGSRWVHEHLAGVRLEAVSEWRILYLYGRGFANQVLHGRWRPGLAGTDGYAYGDREGWLRFLAAAGIEWVLIGSEHNLRPPDPDSLVEVAPATGEVYPHHAWAAGLPQLFHLAFGAAGPGPAGPRPPLLEIYRVDREALGRHLAGSP